MHKIFLLFLTLTIGVGCQRSPLKRILSESPDTVRTVAHDPAHEVQIMYVQIDRDADNRPEFRASHFNTHADYFYPASTVKLPMALLALEKINDLAIPGLSRSSRMHTDSVRPPQSKALLDSTSESGVPTVEHYVHKIFVVSDNDAFNRLYEFVGWDEIQTRLRSHGLARTRIVHRLSDARFGPAENRYTNPVQFFHQDTLVYSQPERVAKDSIEYRPRKEVKGVAYINPAGERVGAPFDFSMKNYYPLEDQVRTLQLLFFPESFPASERFNLSEADQQFVYQAMCLLPRESKHPAFDTSEYFDSYVKFFMFGDSKEGIPPHIRIFNKVGWAYGYLTDCAYIVDFDAKVEFILAATVHVNENNTYNDGEYEYEEVGLPFLAELGRQVYAYELERPRKHEPDLSHLNFTRGYD